MSDQETGGAPAGSDAAAPAAPVPLPISAVASGARKSPYPAMAPGGGPAGPAVHVPPPNPATAGDDPADDWVQDEPEEEEVGPVGGSSMPGGSQPGGPMGALPGGPTGAASRMRQNPANAPSAEPVATTAFDEGGPVEFLYFQPLTLVEACQDYVIENLDSLDLDELDGPTLGAILRRQRATHGVRRITSVALEPYLRPSATEIDISWCAFNNEQMKEIPIRAPNLTSINLSFCTSLSDSGVVAVVDGCPSLTSLNIGWVSLVTDVTLHHIAEGPAPRLVSLNCAGCHQLTNAGVSEVGAASGALVEVDFGECRELTDAGLIVLVANNPSLTSLNLSGCERVSGSFALDISATGLTTLNLSLCDQLEESHMATLLSKVGPTLVDLSVFGDVSLTDTTFNNIAVHCRALRSLDASACVSISDDGLETVAEQCENLVELNASACPGVERRLAFALVRDRTL